MESTCRRLADAGAGAGYDGDATGAGHSLMVGGAGQATDCSFSITLGILFGRDSRQEAREGHGPAPAWARARSEEHTSELQSPCNLVCRLLLEKKNTIMIIDVGSELFLYIFTHPPYLTQSWMLERTLHSLILP